MMKNLLQTSSTRRGRRVDEKGPHRGAARPGRSREPALDVFEREPVESETTLSSR